MPDLPLVSPDDLASLPVGSVIMQHPDDERPYDDPPEVFQRLSESFWGPRLGGRSTEGLAFSMRAYDERYLLLWKAES